VTHACTTFCRTYCVPLQISPKKCEKHAFYVETLRRQNGTDLVSKPINWIWSCALRSFFGCPIALSIVVENLLKGQFLESDGNPKVVFTCARQMLWPGPRKVNQRFRVNFQKPFSRESWFFTATRFSLQNGYANAFCSDPHWLLIHHQNPKSIL